MIEQKDMIFDHDFGYSFPLFSSLVKKEGRRKGEWIAKTVIKSYAFLRNLHKPILSTPLLILNNFLATLFI